MKKRVLRLLLGFGYVVLLTTLLFYQAGTFAEARRWEVAVLGTLLLGVALAAVLALYIRVNDQIGREGRTRGERKQRRLKRERNRPVAEIRLPHRREVMRNGMPAF